MKNLIIFLFIIFISLTNYSCLDNDDSAANYSYVSIPIDSVNLPERVVLGNDAKITTFLNLKEGCQGFHTYGYDAVGNERTVVAWALQDNNITCGEEITYDPYLNFTPLNEGVYTFRFWAGIDEQTNEDVFITKEITIYIE